MPCSAAVLVFIRDIMLLCGGIPVPLVAKRKKARPPNLNLPLQCRPLSDSSSLSSCLASFIVRRDRLERAPRGYAIVAPHPSLLDLSEVAPSGQKTAEPVRRVLAVPRQQGCC